MTDSNVPILAATAIAAAAKARGWQRAEGRAALIGLESTVEEMQDVIEVQAAPRPRRRARKSTALIFRIDRQKTS